MRLRIALSLSLAFAVTACIPRAEDRPRKPVRPTYRPATMDTRTCLADLDRMKARYSLLPDEDYGSGCSLNGAVQLLGAGIPVTNVRAIKCDMARNLTLWLRETVQPAARDAFGSPVARLESMGAYSCRNIIGNPAVAGNRSEHATGNAIDIGGFVLADGRRVTVKAGWSGEADERSFLRTIRKGACQRFQTVLSPDYNAAHHDHLHFDLGKGPYCR
jgi:hypothetical protein